MKMKLFLVIVLIPFFFSISHSQNILLKNINVINVETGEITQNTNVYIKDGKIHSVGTTLPRMHTKEYDCTGNWLIPGLIDSHIHMFQSGGIYTRPDIIDLQKFRDYETETKWVWDNTSDFLKRYLRCGITSVIDMGGPFENFKKREEFSDNTEFPNIFVTGPLISTYQPEAFMIDDSPILKVKTKEEAIKLVRKELKYKPDFIKIWYIARYDETAEQNFDIIKATIEESHKHNLKVAVHATELNTAKLALKAGADILVHSIDDPVDDEFIALMKKNNAVYIPTLVVHKNYSKTFLMEPEITDEDLAFANPFTLGSIFDLFHLPDLDLVESIKRMAFTRSQQQISLKQEEIRKQNLLKLSEAGIIIATGTDAGNIGTQHASSYYDELDKMKQAGLSNREILLASTLHAAKVLDKDNYLGTIEENKLADMLVLNENPLDDLNALKNIKYVIKAGKLHQADKILNITPEELVQMQVNAYNARNLNAFMNCYANDVEAYSIDGKLLFSGADAMRKRYIALFKSSPNLHCEIKNRIVHGNTVIDYEKVTGFRGNKTVQAIAIYTIENNKIKTIRFIY